MDLLYIRKEIKGPVIGAFQVVLGNQTSVVISCMRLSLAAKEEEKIRHIFLFRVELFNHHITKTQAIMCYQKNAILSH